MARHIKLGRKGEELAKRFLEREGFKIIKTNFRTKIGQIDIVAKEENCLCFIEVKTRRGNNFGPPEEAVTVWKQHKILKLALEFTKFYSLRNAQIRFDIVSVNFNGGKLKINLIKNAFEASKHLIY